MTYNMQNSGGGPHHFSNNIKDFFSDSPATNSGGGSSAEQNRSPTIPSFIKQGGGASGSQKTSHNQPVPQPPMNNNALLALDSLEPVLVVGENNPVNNPSPQSFMGINKGGLGPGGQGRFENSDGITSLDSEYATPQGDPQFVGLSQITYAGHTLQVNEHDITKCTRNDFSNTFIEQTLKTYYGKTNQQNSSKAASGPQTGHRLKKQDGEAAKESKQIQQFLQKARQNPSHFSKVSFKVRLPFEMLLQQIQISPLKQTEEGLQAADRSPMQQTDCFDDLAREINADFENEEKQESVGQDQEVQSGSSTKQQAINFAQKATNMMNIVSNKTSANPSGFNSFIAAQQPHNEPLDDHIEQNQLQKVTFGKDVLILSVTKDSVSQEMVDQSENRNDVLIRSAFCPKVTPKRNVEINTAEVVKEVTITFLCATEAAENLFKSQSEPSKKAQNLVQNHRGVIDEKMSLEDESNEKEQQDPKFRDPLDFGDLNDALQDDVDDEVALISRQHFDRQKISKGASGEKQDTTDAAAVDPDDIQFRLGEEAQQEGIEDMGLGQGKRPREGSEEDQFGEIDAFRMANMLNNDEEDDLRILDSLPTNYKPPELTVKTTSNDATKQNNKSNQNSLKRLNEMQESSAKQRTNSNVNQLDFDGMQQFNCQESQQLPPLARILDKIVLYGFNVNTIPAITNLTHFLNTSFYLKQQERNNFEVEFLATVILITSKRATQAAEILRKLESTMVRKLKLNLSKLEKLNEINQNNRNDSCDSVEEHEIRTQTQDIFIRCAIFELLIADALSFETQLNEKIQALERMVAFSLGQIPAKIRFAPQIMVSDDAFSALLRILPQLLRFCILSLTNKREIVKMSSLKILKFVFENQGCSLDFSMVYILKGMFLTYPTGKSRLEGKENQDGKEKYQNSSKKQDSGDPDPYGDDYPESPTTKAAKDDDNKTCSSKFGKDGSFEKRDQIQNQIGIRVPIDNKEYKLEKLVGKAEATTLTIADFLFPAPTGQGRGHKSLLSISHNQNIMTHQTVENVVGIESEESQFSSRFTDLKEPKSGFQTALANVYSHVLDTLISVLSSISSHILHSIFYDVIEGSLTISQGQGQEEIQFLENASKKSEISPLSPARKRMKDTLKNQNSQKIQSMPDEIRVYACKIAEKIITICQGDLLISHQFLNSLLTVYSHGSKKSANSFKQLGIDQSTTQGQQAFISIKNLWLSIRQKVFPHYSTLGYRLLIDWLSTRLSLLVHTKKPTSKELLDTKPKKQADTFPEELSDEEQLQLTQICDIITIVTLGRVKSEEEASQLIKLPPAESFGEGTSAEMYILLPQLIFWLEYSIDREDRLPLFQQLYSTIKKVVESSPRESKTQVCRLDVATIIMPSLVRTNTFLKHNSPSLPMLKFLDITLADFQLYLLEKRDLYRMAAKQNHIHLQGQTRSPVTQSPSESMIQGQNMLKHEIEELQSFFLEFLENFVKSISYSLYEEVFVVFDRLLQLTGDMLSEKVLRQCIIALVDKYTLKSKQHKSSMNHFMKFLLDAKNRPRSSRKNTLSPSGMIDDVLSSDDPDQKSYLGEVTFFEVMTDFCFFENIDTSYKQKSRQKVNSSNSRMEQEFGQNQVDRGDRKRMIDDREEYNSLEMSQLDFRGPLDMHEIFIDRLQFFIDSLSLMKEEHLGQFTTLITHPAFKETLMRILDHGETSIRLKSFEILEALTAYFVQYCPSKTVYQMENDEVMDAEFISHERIYISQLVIQVVRRSLEQTHDCYLQFNALILLDFLFQNLLPVPTFMNEQLRNRQQNRVTLSPDGITSSTDANKHQTQQETSGSGNGGGGGTVLDIDAKISEVTPELDVMDPIYLRMRMKLVLSLWGHIKSALSSPWSNIRSICYGLVCSMLKIKVSDYPISETAGYATNDQRALSGFSNDKGNANPVTNLSEILGDGAGLSDDLNAGATSPDCLQGQEERNENGSNLDKKEKKEEMGNPKSFQNNMAGGCVLFSDSDAVLSSDPTLSLQANLKVVLPMLYTLLSSKESESKAGGLNILGSFCGLSYDFSKVSIHQNLAFLQRNSQFVSLPIWRLVFQLQDDWDITIKEASVVLIQLCAPRNAIIYFQSLKQKNQERKLAYLAEQRMNEINGIYGPVLQNFRQQPYTKSNQRLGRPESQLKLKNFLLNRSQGARRAFEQFPTRTDTQEILGIDASGESNLWTQNESIEKSLFADVAAPDQPSLQEYLIGSYLNQVGISGSQPYEKVVTLFMIEQEHKLLAEKVREFDPNYEDTRLTNQLSRRRQLEIELGVKRPSRKESSGSDGQVCFFVDQYSDDQISEIISIFRNDFKPPKNLWIEKQPAPYMLSSGGINSSSMPQGSSGVGGAQGAPGNASPDYFGDIYAEAIEQFNQQQALMQEQQQNKLQQQVSVGSTSSSNANSTSSQSQGDINGSPDQAISSNASGQSANNNSSNNGLGTSSNQNHIDGSIIGQQQQAAADQKENGHHFDDREDKQTRISSSDETSTSANYPNQNGQSDLINQRNGVNSNSNQQQSGTASGAAGVDRGNLLQGKLGIIGPGPRISPNLGGPAIDALEDQLVRQCGENQEIGDLHSHKLVGGSNLERSPASSNGQAHQMSHESGGEMSSSSHNNNSSDQKNSQILLNMPQNQLIQNKLAKDQAGVVNHLHHAQIVRPRKNQNHLSDSNAFSPSLIVELPKEEGKRNAKKQSTTGFNSKKISKDSKEALEKIIQVSKEQRKKSVEKQIQNDQDENNNNTHYARPQQEYVPKKQLRAKESKESLQFQQIMLDDIQIRPDLDRIGRSRQHAEVVSDEEQPYEEVNFSEDQAFDDLQHMRSSEKNGSRLGKRSSRLHMQEELLSQQVQLNNMHHEAPQMAYHDDSYRSLEVHVNNVRANNRGNKGKSDRLLLSDGFVDQGSSSNKVDGNSLVAISIAEAKTESRKKRRNQGGSKSFRSQEKKEQLQLIENDYFSPDDKLVAQLRNLTQKFSKQNMNKMYPQSIHVGDRSKDDSYRQNGKKKDLLQGKKGTTSEELLRKQQMRQIQQANSGQQSSTSAFNEVRLMKQLEGRGGVAPRDDKNQLNSLVKEIVEGNLSPASKQRELMNLDPTLFMKKIEKELNRKIRQQKESNLSPQNLLKSIELQLQELSREPGSGLSQAAAQAIAVKLALSVSKKDGSGRNRSNSQGESKKRKKSNPPKLKLAGLNNLYNQQAQQHQTGGFANHDSTNNMSSSGTPNQSSTQMNKSANLKFMTKSHLNILRSSFNKLQKMNSSNQNPIKQHNVNNQSTTIGAYSSSQHADDIYPFTSAASGPKSKRSASNKDGRNRSAESRGSSRQPQRKKSGSLLSGQQSRGGFAGGNHQTKNRAASSNGSSNGQHMSGGAIMPVKQMLLATNLQGLQQNSQKGGINMNQPSVLLTERIPRQVGGGSAVQFSQQNVSSASARKKKASSNEREEKSNTAGLLGKHLLSAVGANGSGQGQYIGVDPNNTNPTSHHQLQMNMAYSKNSKTVFHKKNSKSVTKGALSAMTTHHQRQSSRGKQQQHSSKNRGGIPSVSKLISADQGAGLKLTKSRQGSESQQQQPSSLVYQQQMSIEGEPRANKSFSGIGGIPRGPSSANPKSKKIKQIVTSLQQQSQENKNGQTTSDTKLLLQILSGAQNGSSSVRNTEFNTARDLLDGIGVNSSTSSQNNGSLGNSGTGIPNKKAAMNSIFFQQNKKKANEGSSTVSQVQMNKALLSPSNQQVQNTSKQNYGGPQSNKLSHTATNILYEVLQNQSGLTNLQQVGGTGGQNSGVHQSEKSLNSSSITGKSTTGGGVSMAIKRKHPKSKEMSNLAINVASQGHTANPSVTQLQKGSLTSRNIQMPRFDEAFQGKGGFSPPISSRNKPKKQMKEKAGVGVDHHQNGGSAQRNNAQKSIENLSPKIKKDPKLVGGLIKLNM